MIKVTDIYKSFYQQAVLQGVNLNIERGHNLIVLVRSGTGKSVLLKIIVGLIKPERGTVRLLDEEVTSIDHDALNRLRQHIGFLFQDGALYDSMTLKENVAFPLRRHTRL